MTADGLDLLTGEKDELKTLSVANPLLDPTDYHKALMSKQSEYIAKTVMKGAVGQAPAIQKVASRNMLHLGSSSNLNIQSSQTIA